MMDTELIHPHDLTMTAPAEVATPGLSRRTRKRSEVLRLTIGRSVERRRLDAWLFAQAVNEEAACIRRGNAGERRRSSSIRRRPPFSRILVFGGFHGDEPKAVSLAFHLIDVLGNKRTTGQTAWCVVPLVNPDGFHRRTRRNARRVDINRNFPTADWERGNPRSRMFGGVNPESEPETRAVVRLVDRFCPDLIITIHSISGGRFCNNYDGPGRQAADALRRHNRYPVTHTIGYPTPGSFGTWAGVERGIPTVTLELPAEHSFRRCRQDNSAAILSLGQ